jgi:hypothetical protein
MEELEFAFREAAAGILPRKPVLEMTIPSAVDDTLVNQAKAREWAREMGLNGKTNYFRILGIKPKPENGRGRWG